MYPNIHSSIIYNCQDMEATCVHQQINRKEDVVYIYIHNGILLSHKKEGNFAICSNMDGPGGLYAK